MSKKKKRIVPYGIKETDPNSYIDDEGNEIPLATPHVDRSGNVVVEVPSGQLNLFGKDTKEGKTQHHSIQGSISFGMNINAKMEFTPASENKEPDSFEKKLQSWFRILPKKFREGYIGDLLEDRAILEKTDVSKWRINLITLSQFLIVLFATRWIWFQDLIQSVFKYFKELIQ